MTTSLELSSGFEELSRIALETYNRTLDELLDEKTSSSDGMGAIANLLDLAADRLIDPESIELELDSSKASGAGRQRKKRNFFFHLAAAICKQVQSDSTFRQHIDSAIEESRSDIDRPVAMRNVVGSTAAISLATYIQAHFPDVACIGPAGIAGILIIFLNIGSNAFCSWVAENSGT